MAQTVGDLESDGFVGPRRSRRRPRALVALTAEGRAALAEDRRHREGWLAGALDERLTARERRVVEEAVEILRRLADVETQRQHRL